MARHIWAMGEFMTWTKHDEAEWKRLTDQREKHKSEVGKLAFIKQLRDLADAVESGRQNIGEQINIEFVRADVPYGYDGVAPVIGRRITVYMNEVAP